MENTNSSAAQPNRANGMANLRYGVYNQPSNIAGKSISDVRQQLPIVAKTSLMRTLLFSPARTLSSTAVQAKRAD